MIQNELLRARQAQLEKIIEASEFDCLLFNPSPTLGYLTGMNFHMSERPVVLMVRPGHIPALVLPELEAAKAKDLGYPLNVFSYGENPLNWPRAFQKAAHAIGLPGLNAGVEAAHFRVLELQLLEEAAPGTHFNPSETIVAKLRMYKDAAEQAAHQSAARMAEAALERTLAAINIGMSEKDIQSQLVINLLQESGSPTLPFSPIVASGPNSANPHAHISDRPLQEGDLLLFDWGASANGYFSDITRTFSVGDVDPELTTIGEVVHAANRAARHVAGPGIPMGEVDRAARQVITEAGYGEYFIHRTGHGLGLETHEEPYIRGDNAQLLEPGMVFTIEPGIYLPDRGGVRIEDDVVVTNSGIHSFTTMSRAVRPIN